MSKKLYISLIFSNLVVIKTLSSNHRMYVHTFIQNSSKYLRYASNYLKNSPMNRGMFHTAALFIGFSTWKYRPYPFGRDRGH